MRKNVKKIGIVIVVVIAVSLAGYGAYKGYHAQMVRTVYEQAQDMIEQGQYEEAGSLLGEIAEEEAAYEEKIKNGVPFVGMPESRIADTSLGRPSSTVRHNNEVTGGKVYQANLYDFVKNGITYFTARCVQGKVIQVWDNRDLLGDSDSGSSENKSSSSGSGGRIISGASSSGSKEDGESDEDDSEEDSYNVYDYDDPEEFCYDYYDDFDGYEDAETYWYDAWR